MPPIYKNIIRLIALLTIIIMYTTKFYFLSLNTLLAYIPLELSFHIKDTRSPILQVILGCIWLLFFPNIPYLVTDIVHSDMLQLYNYADGSSLPSVRLWALLIALFLVIFAFNLWGFSELLKLARYFKDKFQVHPFVMRMIIGGICFLSAMGIYAGRFPPRLHSIYFLTDPLKVFDIIFLQWSQKKLEFVLLFFILHLGILTVLYIQNLLMERKFENI
ncbi:hypothetical protein RV01_GL001054 [Enterococcus dispar]|nr:hypothetical protein RV01_GL001054 [Enterococcus dispar]